MHPAQFATLIDTLVTTELNGNVAFRPYLKSEKITDTHYRVLTTDIGMHDYQKLWLHFQLQKAGSILIHDNGVAKANQAKQGNELNMLEQLTQVPGLSAQILDAIEKCKCTGQPVMQDDQGCYFVVNLPKANLRDTAHGLEFHLSMCLHSVRLDPSCFAEQAKDQIHYIGG